MSMQFFENRVIWQQSPPQSISSNEYFDGSQPMSTPPVKEIPGLAKIACEIRFLFFGRKEFLDLIDTIKDAANRLFAGKGTEQDKAFVRLELKNHKDMDARGLYSQSENPPPDGVVKNYLAKLDRLVAESQVV